MQDDPASEQRVCPQCGNVTAARTCPHDGWETIPRARVDASVSAPTDVLGRWQASALLARDGRLSIWGGQEVATRRPVRIAVVALPATAELADVARMQRGAKSLEELSHKRLARVLATGLDERGDLVVVSEQVAGPTLTELLGRSLGADRTTRLALQFFDALDAAHTAGVMHHELTPDHVRVTREHDGSEGLVVQDIGLADLARLPHGGIEPDPTQLEPRVARYRAPEQLRDRALTRHADIYAVGAILYEALCGRPVFDERTAADYLVAHLVKLPDRPTIDGEPVDGPLVELVLRCLEKKPWNRPESAAAARDRLRDAMGETFEETPRAPRVVTSSVTRVITNTGQRKSSRVVSGSRQRVPVAPPPLPMEPLIPELPPLPSTPPPGPRPATRSARRATASVVPAPMAPPPLPIEPEAPPQAPIVIANVDEPRRGPIIAHSPAPLVRARRPWWPWAVAVAALVALAFVVVGGLGPEPIQPVAGPMAERAPSDRADATRRPSRATAPTRAAPAVAIEARRTEPPAPASPVSAGAALVTPEPPTVAPPPMPTAAKDEPLELEPIVEAPTPPVAEPTPTKPAAAKPGPTKPTNTKPPSVAEARPDRPADKPEPKPAEAPPLAAASRRAMLASTPSGASVIVGGRTIGKTPMTVSWFDGDEPTLQLVMDGYEPAMIALEETHANRMLSLALVKDARPRPAAASKPAAPVAEPPQPTEPAPEEEAPKKSLLERDWRPR